MPFQEMERQPGESGQRKHSDRSWLIGLAVAGLLATGVSVVAVREAPRPVVITQEATRSRSAPPRPDSTETEEVQCEGVPPGPGWGCHEGRWQFGAPTSTSGSSGSATSGDGGRADRMSGCLSDRPGPSFVCQNGLWMIVVDGAGGSSVPMARDVRGTDPERCPPPDPGDGWTCREGGWVPEDSRIRSVTPQSAQPTLLPAPSEIPGPIPAASTPVQPAAAPNP
jgi:hypothetical protein